MTSESGELMKIVLEARASNNIRIDSSLHEDLTLEPFEVSNRYCCIVDASKMRRDEPFLEPSSIQCLMLMQTESTHRLITRHSNLPPSRTHCRV